MKMKAQQYLSQGYSICNALIENAEISTTEGPALSISLKLPNGGGSISNCMGHLDAENKDILGWEHGMSVIFHLMKVAGVTTWSGLRKQPVRAVVKDKRIYAIGHFLYDDFLDYRLYPSTDNGGV